MFLRPLPNLGALSSPPGCRRLELEAGAGTMREENTVALELEPPAERSAYLLDSVYS